ncbi:MAG: hypothetical protein IJX01_00500 [Oscillospiraceae bacterium]|nr:hypothetical protein [Oscillospiraceae bacterium]
MNLWNEIVEVLIKVKNLFLGLSTDQITLISVAVTLIIFMAGQRSETRFKKHEGRRAEYKKFIELLQKSLSGGIKPDEKGKQVFFDTGVSLLLYGSKHVYKKYIFFREYSINPIVQKSKYNNPKVLLYIVADILKAIRHEVGLTSLSDLESNEALSFFVNDLGSNPISRIESYKSRYNIFMIKSEIFFYNRYKLLTTKKLYYHIIKPILGVVGLALRYLLISIGKLLFRVKGASLQQEKPIPKTDKDSRETNIASKDKESNSGQQHKRGFFKGLFEIEWRAQSWVVHNIWGKTKAIGRFDIICLIILSIDVILVITRMIPWKFGYYMLVLLSVAMLIYTFLKDSQRAMTTLGGFLELGMCLIIVIGIVMALSFAIAFKDILAGATGQYLVCIIISIVLALIWGAYSSFCNAGVATLANALLAGVIGLIILTKDVLVETFFVDTCTAMFSSELIAQIEAGGYSTSQFVDGVFSLLFYPFLLMTGFATMVCAAKKYWIGKYNDGEDIDTLVQK